MSDSSTSLTNRILALARTSPGLTDREITDRLVGRGAPQQPVNQACRALAERGLLARRPRDDGRIGNYPVAEIPGVDTSQEPRLGATLADTASKPALTEDDVKRLLAAWLQKRGWTPTVAWQHDRGIDIDARRDRDRWVIEVKGCGSLQPMRVNYFLAVLGELLQHMDDPIARYSIALPDMAQFRGLWSRLPSLAKSRAAITALFVREDGTVDEVG